MRCARGVAVQISLFFGLVLAVGVSCDSGTEKQLQPDLKNLLSLHPIVEKSTYLDRVHVFGTLDPEFAGQVETLRIDGSDIAHSGGFFESTIPVEIGSTNFQFELGGPGVDTVERVLTVKRFPTAGNIGDQYSKEIGILPNDPDIKEALSSWYSFQSAYDGEFNGEPLQYRRQVVVHMIDSRLEPMLTETVQRYALLISNGDTADSLPEEDIDGDNRITPDDVLHFNESINTAYQKLLKDDSYAKFGNPDADQTSDGRELPPPIQ